MRLERASIVKGVMSFIVAGLCCQGVWPQQASAEGIGHVCRSASYVVPPELAEKARTLMKTAVKQTVLSDGLTFVLAYDDVNLDTGTGFDDPILGAARRDVVTRVLEYMGDVLNQPGTLEIAVFTGDLPGNTVGTAGTSYSGADGFQDGVSLRRLLEASDPNGPDPDITMTIDFTPDDFYLGEDPAGIGSGETDLFTLILHELTHGLGFTSLSDENGEGRLGSDGMGSNPFPNTYATFNSFVTLGAGGAALWGGVPPSLQTPASALTSDNLFFGGANASAQYELDEGQPGPPLFAPATFSTGSSIAHFDEGTGAVMEPILPLGVALREYPAWELESLRDIGWANAAPPSPPADGGDPDAPFPPADSGVPLAAPFAIAAAAGVLFGAGAWMSRRR